jgi:hypothetical protein
MLLKRRFSSLLDFKALSFFQEIRSEFFVFLIRL